MPKKLRGKDAAPEDKGDHLSEALKNMDEGMKRMRDSRPDTHGEILERKREEQRTKRGKPSSLKLR